MTQHVPAENSILINEHALNCEPVSLTNDNGEGNKNGKKRNKFILAKQKLCTCIMLFQTIPSCCCMTAT